MIFQFAFTSLYPLSLPLGWLQGMGEAELPKGQWATNHTRQQWLRATFPPAFLLGLSQGSQCLFTEVVLTLTSSALHCAVPDYLQSLSLQYSFVSHVTKWLTILKYGNCDSDFM